MHTKYALKMAVNNDPQIESPFIFQLAPISSYESEASESKCSLKLPVWPFYSVSLRQVGVTSEVDFKPTGPDISAMVADINGDMQKKKKPYTRKLKKPENSVIQSKLPPSLNTDVDFSALFGEALKDLSTLA